MSAAEIRALNSKAYRSEVMQLRPGRSNTDYLNVYIMG